ncbi:hypothetical protein EJ08DRAFT_616471 [Tothia fuscella]|uniref:DUF2306 domain-containing protein n=1 Tax=Tothia fuscella TaxID=1048955 RepID=A0A9P4NLR0_9PEZI|nr:hypothetical protein EJ08DRAFT_616471 [Tothia fuscella]
MDISSSPARPARSDTEKAPSKSRHIWQRLYAAVGFSKGYNFILFFIFAGAMMGFVLARLSYLNIGGAASSSFKNGSSPGEWYWYKTGVYRIGITLHLGAILPAGFLMVWQFVPIIRHKAILIHRINGYAIVLLVFIANAGALMICRRSFGGTIETQAGVVTLVFLTTTSICLAFYNIKRLQIDQHRAWMLRAMFYLGTIITLRIIMIISALITSQVSNYYSTMPCDEIASLYDSNAAFSANYPQCNTRNGTVDGRVVVKAKFGSQPEQIGASLGLSFGMAMWLALILHLVGVEIYLALTPREGNRLRQVSYERQMEQGYEHPGSAGITSDHWGDADEWKPVESLK